MTGKIKYCWYCIVSKNRSIRTLKKKSVNSEIAFQNVLHIKFYVNGFPSISSISPLQYAEWQNLILVQGNLFLYLPVW